MLFWYVLKICWKLFRKGVFDNNVGVRWVVSLILCFQNFERFFKKKLRILKLIFKYIKIVEKILYLKHSSEHTFDKFLI